MRGVRSVEPAAARTPAPAGPGPGRFATTVATVAVPVALAAGLGLATARGPVTTLGAIGAVLLVGVLLLRVEIAAMVFVAVEPFETYAKTISGSSVKLLGALLFVAWLLRAFARGTPLRLSHPALRAAGVLLLFLLAATVVHPNGSVGLQVLARYLSYLGAFVVLADSMRDRLAPRVVARVYVLACGVAAVIGLVTFFAGNLRAGGPLGDPNDFAFFLVAALPLAIALRGAGRSRHFYDLLALVVVVAVLATLSRGAIVGLVAMLVFAVATRRIRAHTLVAGLVVAGLAVLAVFVADGGTVQTRLQEKGHVAQQNVNDRLQRWQAAAEMAADHPVLGLGPAGFRTNYNRYIDYRITDATQVLDVAHETYLEVAAELGLPALLAFLAVLGFGFAGAMRGSARGQPQAPLAAAVSISLVGAAVAALFLTEQYYLPLWLLAALGVALDTRVRPTPYRTGPG